MSSALTATRDGTRSAVERVVLVGVVAGFTSGLFGVGGGIIIVPALVLFASFDQKLATGTSLTAIVPIAISGIIGYATDGEVDFAAAAFIAIGAMAGAIVGTRWLKQIKAPVLQVVFAGVMLVTALRMFFGDADATGRGDLTVGMVIGLVALGLASGMLAGLLGVGGGIIIVPALSVIFGVPHVLAKGTSLAVILPTAITGTIRNVRSRLTDMRSAAIVGLAGVVTAWLASQLSLGLDPDLSQSLFAVLLILVAGQLGWRGVRELRAPHGESAPSPAPDPVES